MGSAATSANGFKHWPLPTTEHAHHTTPRAHTMQFILLVVGLFAIACVLYGIAAGVGAIQRSLAWLVKSEKAPCKPPLATPDAAEPAKGPHIAANRTHPSPIQRNIEELRELFQLYQQGALSKEEYEGMKQYLLSGITQAHTARKANDATQAGVPTGASK